MADTAGYSAQIKNGANVVANVKSVQFDISRLMEDTSAFLATPSAYKSFTPTQAEMTCSMTAFWDLTDTNGQLAMQNALINATLLTFTLTPNNGTNTYVFSAYVKKIGLKDDVSKINEVSYDLQPSGSLVTT